MATHTLSLSALNIFVAFLAYCLQITLKNKLAIHAPGLTPTAVLEKLATIQMIDVRIPTLRMAAR